jgi:hypothetical protein
VDLFAVVDTSGDGKLDAAELKVVLERLDIPATDFQVWEQRATPLA